MIPRRGRTADAEFAMHPYPHVYSVGASGTPAGPVPLRSENLRQIDTAPPSQFDGPGDLWSPETLLTGALADCFLFTFRAVARASTLEWERLDCTVDATLEKAEGITRFTGYLTHARLTIAAGVDAAKAHRALERTEQACLIANSLNGARTLDVEIVQPPG
jgi:organic hydroperoxide reductase OsmC/OhrA